MIYLDFDGVLFDSAREAFEVGCQTVFGYKSRSSDACQWMLFKSLRHLVTAAWHYRSVFESISANLGYDAACAALRDAINAGPVALDKEFETKFFQCRQEWIDRDREDWLRQSSPTVFFRKIERLLVAYPQLFTILSTRNENSIIEILSMHVPLNELRILGSHIFSLHGESKLNIILSEGPEPGSLFIDDGVEHLVATNGIVGLVSFHARWGYVESSLMYDNSEEAFRLVIDNLKEA